MSEPWSEGSTGVISFYETTLIKRGDPDEPIVGVEVLASPTYVEGVYVEYNELFEDVPFIEVTGSWEDPYGPLGRFLAVIADPTSARYAEDEQWSARVLAGELPPHRRLVDEFVEQLLTEPLVAAEASLLGKHSLGELLKGASIVAVIGGGTAALGGSPLLAFVVPAGLVVVKALWKGAEPEVEDFGGDVAATVLGALRKKLGIKRRRRRN